MTIAIEEDHLALLDAVRRFTTDRCPPSVARAAMDAGASGTDALPPFWEALSALGWVGLAVPEADGGEGYGYAELAVVLEELGRVIAPGPALPTTWAAAVIGCTGSQSSPSSQGTPRDRLADLASGRSVGSVALTGGLAGRTARAGTGRTGESITVSGTTGPVLCGAVADLLIVPVMIDGVERWGLVLTGDVGDPAIAAVPLESLDATRPLARFELTDAPVVLLPDVTRADVETVGAALAAAECAGGAAWCVTTAAEYAGVRRQFGRPIGQFQAVKHRCADMLVHLEQIRAVAWDAAAALDGCSGGDGGAGAGSATRAEAHLSASAAGAIAFEGFASVAKDCIQVLGGIGFTWEHDAHLYLRRALALRQLFARGRRGSSHWRAATARAALDGVRRELSLDLPPEAEHLRDEVRAAVEAVAVVPKHERRTPLADAGLIVPHWAAPWGRDAGALEQLVIDEELRRAKVRVPHLAVGAWAAPTIAVHGTVEQQERWVGPTLRGEIAWCQLFSEPEAGSDLASLSTRATRAPGADRADGADGGWLLNGQKVWTSMAKEADWGICLARTTPLDETPKHLGITYFIIDMRSPGLDIRPLRELTGMEMFNEVFFDDVFVPDDCVIGEVDGGWPLARTTLANERVSMGSGSSFGGGIEALLGLVGERIGTGELSLDDALLLDELGGLVAEAHSLAVMGLRTAVRSVTGASPGSEASVRKLLGVEHDQRTQEVGLGLLGPEGATTVGAAAQWTFGVLANRCLTIAGGTSEIQRNVIGERLLGLPRDPEPIP